MVWICVELDSVKFYCSKNFFKSDSIKLRVMADYQLSFIWQSLRQSEKLQIWGDSELKAWLCWSWWMRTNTEFIIVFVALLTHSKMNARLVWCLEMVLAFWVPACMKHVGPMEAKGCPLSWRWYGWLCQMLLCRMSCIFIHLPLNTGFEVPVAKLEVGYAFLIATIPSIVQESTIVYWSLGADEKDV